MGTEIILGMAKGRVEFLTESGNGGAGKRISSELDVLRLVYAAKHFRDLGQVVHAYFCILQDSTGKSTRDSIDTWLRKYQAAQTVRVLERVLNDDETRLLRAEKSSNALAQAGRGGSANAALAKKLGEDFLLAEIKARHPLAKPGNPYAKPFDVDWDAWYVVE